VISFHSLEDRLVKNKFKSLSMGQEGIILTKRPLWQQMRNALPTRAAAALRRELLKKMDSRFRGNDMIDNGNDE